MKVRLLAAATVVSAISAALAVGYELHYGGKIVKVKKQTGVFDSEYAAAYYRSLNRKPVPPIASIAGGERVAVLWDTYGKDYWACYVRTSKGERGWVLCTSLAMDA
jgi:hypothetical protein